MYYQKKPVTIKAFDFSQTQVDDEGKPLYTRREIVQELPTLAREYSHFIETLEGEKRIRPDDFIIIGVKGEKYPIRRDIFLETYEAVEEPKAS